jgi:hypothetical protein
MAACLHWGCRKPHSQSFENRGLMLIRFRQMGHSALLIDRVVDQTQSAQGCQSIGKVVA